MDSRAFRRYTDRDLADYATGVLDSQCIPQHRLGGMGGRRRETPSAIITFNSIVNGLIETDPWWQQEAVNNGWKLRMGDDPTECPVWHRNRGWLMLDDDYGVRRATRDEVKRFQDSR